MKGDGRRFSRRPECLELAREGWSDIWLRTFLAVNHIEGDLVSDWLLQGFANENRHKLAPDWAKRVVGSWRDLMVGVGHLSRNGPKHQQSTC
jgi:hypothetical protein